MGRCKISIKFLENKNARVATYRKRSTGLLKKADELHVLCGATVFLRIRPLDQGATKEYDSKRRDVYVRSCAKKQGSTSRKQAAAKAEDDEDEEDDEDDEEQTSSNASTANVKVANARKVVGNRKVTVKDEPQGFAEKIAAELQSVDMATLAAGGDHSGLFSGITSVCPSYQLSNVPEVSACYSQQLSNVMEVSSYPHQLLQPKQDPDGYSQQLPQPKQDPDGVFPFQTFYDERVNAFEQAQVFNQVVPQIDECPDTDFLFEDGTTFNFDPSHDGDATFFADMFTNMDQMGNGNTWLPTPV